MAFPPKSLPFSVIVLGGYGNFGSIIARRLVTIPGIDVIVAGRDPLRAETLAKEIGARAVLLDIDKDGLADQFAQIGAHLVISTVGPFQGQDYRVAQAAITAHTHYVDLADAREFVCGIHTLNSAALAHNVLVTSGASSVPALAAAVIDSLLPQFSRLDVIHHGISSSEKIPGVATVAAALSYCGKPIRQWRNGRWARVYGWQGLTSYNFSSPLNRRWMANCDIPDLELFPARYPSVRSVCFSAGVGLRVTQLGTWVLSWLVRSHLLDNAARLASVLHTIAVKFEFLGDGLSGMFVKLKGIGRDGKPLNVSWEIVARQNHGPNIPCMAAVVIARKLASNQLTERGARPCIGLLTLNDYLAELEDLDITTTQRPCYT